MPAGADVVVDAVGSQLATAISSAGMAARIVVFGMNATATPPIQQVEIDRRSPCRSSARTSRTSRSPRRSACSRAGAWSSTPMISAVLPLAEAERAFEMLRSGGATKVIITP